MTAKDCPIKTALLILFVCTACVTYAGVKESTVGHGLRPLQITSGNPIIPGWYADPEAHIFENEYWIYPTYSARYNEQTFFDAFSSKDAHVPYVE